MAEFHFVQDYRNLIASLLTQFPEEVAIKKAVGGYEDWDEMGDSNANLLIACGVKSGMDVLDFGCGCGRVAVKLSNKIKLSSYVGLDVVPELLNYATKICPPDYKFTLNQSLKIPLEDNSLDAAFSFSVFTHLLQTEIHIYLIQIFRKLRNSGFLVFSFLEIDKHWKVFSDSTGQHYRNGKPYPHLNIFLERRQIDFLASKIGFTVTRYIEPYSSEGSFQTVVMLQKL